MPAMLVTIAGAVALGVEPVVGVAAAVGVEAAAFAGGIADVGAAARCTPSGMATATTTRPTTIAMAFPDVVRRRRLLEW